MDDKATFSSNVEIQKMLTKLRGLIPGIPPNRKMTKLEIMQHVIDYISDLETVLQENGANPEELARIQTAAAASFHQQQQTGLVN